MADHRRSVKSERFEQIIKKLNSVLSHGPEPIRERVRESVSGQLDEKRAVTPEVVQQWYPRRGGETDTVEHHEIRPRTNHEDPETKVDGWKMNK
jgi:hypothetical protein